MQFQPHCPEHAKRTKASVSAPNHLLKTCLAKFPVVSFVPARSHLVHVLSGFFISSSNVAYWSSTSVTIRNVMRNLPKT